MKMATARFYLDADILGTAGAFDRNLNACEPRSAYAGLMRIGTAGE